MTTDLIKALERWSIDEDGGWKRDPHGPWVRYDDVNKRAVLGDVQAEPVIEITEVLGGGFKLKIPLDGGSTTTFCETLAEADELSLFWYRGFKHASSVESAAPQVAPDVGAELLAMLMLLRGQVEESGLLRKVDALIQRAESKPADPLQELADESQRMGLYGGWRSMESAPKDSDNFLAVDEFGDIHLASWSHGEHGGLNFYSAAGWHPRFVAWAPLPPMPSLPVAPEPRAMKLLREGVPFFVVKANEPYARQVVALIKADQGDKWTPEDEAWAQSVLPPCEMCNGKGMIGGFVNAENGYDGQPCPDCSPQVAPDVGAELLVMLKRVYDAEFGYGAWPEETEIERLILRASSVASAAPQVAPDVVADLLEILAELKEHGMSWDSRYDAVIQRAESKPADPLQELADESQRMGPNAVTVAKFGSITVENDELLVTGFTFDGADSNTTLSEVVQAVCAYLTAEAMKSNTKFELLTDIHGMVAGERTCEWRDPGSTRRLLWHTGCDNIGEWRHGETCPHCGGKIVEVKP